MQNGVFVDDNCKEFIFSGYNAWQVRSMHTCSYMAGQERMPCMCHARETTTAAVRNAACLLTQTLEMAANMCCGNQAALTTQFQEAGATLTGWVQPHDRRWHVDRFYMGDTCPAHQQSGTEQRSRGMRCAARQSFNVVRIFGFPVQRGFNLQTSPGVYNEAAFVALDRVISEAGKAGLKLIIALTNNWNYNDVQTDWKCASCLRSPILLFALATVLSAISRVLHNAPHAQGDLLPCFESCKPAGLAMHDEQKWRAQACMPARSRRASAGMRVHGTAGGMR